MNPKMEIYLNFLTDDDGIDLEYSELVKALLFYPNIHLRYLNPMEFSKGTKLENFFKRRVLETSIFRLVHTADVMRFLILNKYGGQYLDLDVFSLVPFSITRQNSACREDTDMVANGIINLDVNENKGKKISDLYLE